MTFNPRNYESLYGSPLIDELHNFFPEFMYDEQIFGAEPYMWMRHRLSTLFPQTFVRQRTLYNIYQATPRRTEYETWRFSAFPSVGLRGPARFSNPVRREPTLIEPVVRVRIPARTQEQVDFSLLNTTLTNLLNSALADETMTITPNNNDILRMLYGTAGMPPMVDVPVTATNDVIAIHSEIINRDAVPADTNCAICQERNHETETVWRKLNCSHYFHRTCVDRWFSSNVHCPVCRYDIRTAYVPQSTITTQVRNTSLA